MAAARPSTVAQTQHDGDEILGLKEAKAAVVARDRRFLKPLPAIDARSERQKDALLTTTDGLLRNKAS